MNNYWIKTCVFYLLDDAPINQDSSMLNKRFELEFHEAIRSHVNPKPIVQNIGNKQKITTQGQTTLRQLMHEYNRPWRGRPPIKNIIEEGPFQLGKIPHIQISAIPGKILRLRRHSL